MTPADESPSDSESVDWMSAAAEEAAKHVATTMRHRFGLRAWTEFEARLSEHGERLFRLMHRLYGWRYDFAWSYQQMLEVAAEGFINRPKPLRRIDRKSTVPPSWVSDSNTLIAMTYLDRYAGTVNGLREHLDHLLSLRATHLHLLPPFATPEGPNDGGFAVSDYRHLRAGVGTTKQLRKAAAELRETGVTLILDLIVSGTAGDHPWAQAAAAGDPEYRAFYYLFPDRELPDRFSRHLRPLRPGLMGDSFNWHPEVDGGAWVWSSVSPCQWDLDYSNPAVLAATAREMLSLANLGAGMIRLNGAESLWKQEGTDCQNLPESYLIVQVLEAITRMAAPSISLLNGAMVPSGPRASFIGPEECRAGYDSILTSAVWEALASGATGLLAQALADRRQIPYGCVWITFLRSHDDIGWWFPDEVALRLGIDPEAHRRYLSDFYQGRWPGSTARGQVTGSYTDVQLDNDSPTPGNSVIYGNTASGGSPGISGTAASLAGLETAVEGLEESAADLAVRRLLAAFAVVLGAGGVPMLFLGDEIAQLSDQAGLAQADLAQPNLASAGRADEVQWSHRPHFDWPRLESATAGEGPEGAVLARYLRLLEVRRVVDGFGPEIPPTPFDLGDQGTIGFSRGPVSVVVNMTDRPVVVSRSALAEGELFDLVTEDTWEGHVLGPYEYRYLLNARSQGSDG